MPTSESRVRQIVGYLKDHGVDQTEEQFGLSRSTIRRYQRQAKHLEDHVESYNVPRILLFDLETSPMECYTWGLFKQFLTPDKIIRNSAILTWSAKWLMGDRIFSDRVTVDDARNREDHTIVSSMHEVFNSADIIIGHNFAHFDKKVANTRFILNGFGKPSPYQIVDTYKEAKKHFRFPSNRLNYVSKLLAGKEKLDTSFSLWTRCVNGDDSAIDEMLRYNKQDVRILEEVYLELRPWITSHPNLGLYYDDISDRCPNCGSTGLNNDGYYYTPAGRYRSKKCNECGAYGRERCQDLTTDQRKELRRSQAR